jgi:hypothetical protein
MDGYDADITPRSRPTPTPGPSGEPLPGRSVEGPSVPLREPAEVRGPFPSYARPGQTNGKAIVSLVLAIVGLFIIPIILSVLAIIIGWAALTDIDRHPTTGGKGLAIAGIVIGLIGLVIGIIGVIVAASYNWLIV